MSRMNGDSSLDDIIRIQKKLEKIIAKKEDVPQAKDMLMRLRDANVTLEILQKTRVGLTVNSLRKSINNDPELVTLSKDLIKKWKKLIDGGPATKSSTNSSKNQTSSSSSSTQNNNNSKNGSSSEKSSSSSSSSSNHQDNKSSSNHNKCYSVPATNTSNEVRVKCREMICTALKTPIDLQDDDMIDDRLDPEDLAARIEECIFREFKVTDNRYKNRIRSRYMNLKDARNPDLRLNVLRGAITPEKMAKMEASVS